MLMALDIANVSPSQLAACQALVYNLLQRCEAVESDRGFALALVSAHPGAGVSHIQQLLEQMLNENEADCAIALDCEMLGLSAPGPHGQGWDHDSGAPSDADRQTLLRRSGMVRFRDRVGHLEALRETYRYVLLDCHSIREKTDVLGLAPLVDGTIIVVECNRTTTSQVDELERNIEKYGGTVLGSVLNKTISTVPKWLESLLDKAGI